MGLVHSLYVEFVLFPYLLDGGDVHRMLRLQGLLGSLTLLLKTRHCGAPLRQRGLQLFDLSYCLFISLF
jgi:hypothetical protein